MAILIEHALDQIERDEICIGDRWTGSRVGGRLHVQNRLVPKCSKIIVERRIHGAVLPYLGQFTDDTAVICARPAMDDVDYLVKPQGALGWENIHGEGEEGVGDRMRGVHGRPDGRYEGEEG